MGFGAYILIAGASAAEDRSAMLERAGYRCSVAPAGADLAASIAEENPNVAFVGAAEQSGLRGAPTAQPQVLLHSEQSGAR